MKALLAIAALLTAGCAADARPIASGCSSNCTLTGTTTLSGDLAVNGATGITCSGGTSAAGFIATGTGNTNALSIGDAQVNHTSGARLIFGNPAGANEYFAFDSSGALYLDSISGNGAGFDITANATGTLFTDVVSGHASGALVLRGRVADGANTSVTINNTTILSNASAKLVSIQNNGSEKASVNKDGYLASATPAYLSLAVGTTALVNGATLDGMVLPARAFTATAITGRISSAGSVGTTGLVLTISDGTNTCKHTRVCTGTGNVRIASTNGAGTGCVFPASASLTLTVDATSDCATYPVFLNGGTDVEGMWQ